MHDDTTLPSPTAPLYTDLFTPKKEKMPALRMVTLQNRAALDYVLASQGGTCKVIGIGATTIFIIMLLCMTLWITFKTLPLRSTNHALLGLFDWLKSLFGSWIYHFFYTVF